MVELGYTLSSEEFGPDDLIRYARRAEELGFSFALVSDHYHPWVDQQGHSPFVWSVLGGLSQSTESLRIGTGVTCPTLRIHPAIVAQAAATSAVMMRGRFFLGIGSGENLNEHVVGYPWPWPAMRLDMLEEAVEIIRELWKGDYVTYDGRHFTVERARIYTLPETPPDIIMAAGGPTSVRLAGRVADGMIGLAPSRELIERFEDAGGAGKPKIAQVAVCWAETEEEGRRIARQWWPNAGLGGQLSVELATPSHFEAAVAHLREEDVAQSVVCGPDPQRHLELIGKYVEAGYTHVYVHQVGPDQEGFFDFYSREILPHVGRIPAAV